ncbi:phosphotransferase enzyme family protein [Kribbella sp. NPDC051620]|uniref:phosphotransferase enzyme family protein n=1 Tax=Kribbella sp. NPDC051620 TaxID=3364120 RepID=UPI0037A86E59
MELTDVLAQRWNLTADRLETLSGGMNSQTWLVTSDGVRYVAKSVPGADSPFEPGLELAARLARGGLITGAPIPSRDGRLVERWGNQQLAVLEYVDGIPLLATPEDQQAVGTTLARVHQISQTPSGDLEKWFELITDFDAYLDLEPWIRPAVEGALDGVRALGNLTWAGLHGDPATEAFLRQPDGEIALIDWGSYMTAPLLYDVASAVMYVGTAEHILPAYLAKRPDLTPELTTGLPAFWHFRQAVQASYFAWRITTNVQTGQTPDNNNQTGLANAHHWFISN